ncbi:MAG: hypothetical protein HC880_12455 [Bacteroidia bacterium]|nr:hypothetical protein [Bacteroidia bacterium]
MVGLEPIGTLPDFEDISQKSLGAYFNGIRHSLSTVLEYSFFRTLAMAQDFTGRVVQDIDGTLPNILLFMARTNHEVLYYEKVAINPKGKLVSLEELGEKANELPDSTIYGTRIDYRRGDEPDERKTLYYFQMNLDDNPYFSEGGFRFQGLKQRADVYGYLNSLDITNTYIKSASYLMYRDHFSKIRNLILDKTQYLLQDDSGIPLKYFDQDQWDLTFYGSYVSPIALFQVRYQSDLRAMYAKGKEVKPLPFGIGYQFRAGTSNLMKAVKK